MTPDAKIIDAYCALLNRAVFVTHKFHAVDLDDCPTLTRCGDDARLEWLQGGWGESYENAVFTFPLWLLAATDAEVQAWADETKAEAALERAASVRRANEAREAVERANELAVMAQLKHKYEGGPAPQHTAAQPAPGVLSMPWPPAWPLHPPSMQPGHFSAAPPHFTGLLDDPSLSTGDPST